MRLESILEKGNIRTWTGMLDGKDRAASEEELAGFEKLRFVND